MILARGSKPSSTIATHRKEEPSLKRQEKAHQDVLCAEYAQQAFPTFAFPLTSLPESHPAIHTANITTSPVIPT
jgi:hypothetical protein